MEYSGNIGPFQDSQSVRIAVLDSLMNQDEELYDFALLIIAFLSYWARRG